MLTIKLKSTKKPFLFAALLFILLTGMGCGKSDQPKERDIGKLAPDFSLVSLDGQKLSRESLKGNVVILDFWATWCPPCRAAIPHLVELDRKYGPEGLVIIGISLDRGGQDEVMKFAKENRISYDLVMGTENDILKAFGNITSIPTIILLNQKSEIIFKAVGYNSDIAQTIDQKIAKLLRQE